MSASGIIPDPSLGGVVVTSLPGGSGVTNAYVPPVGFTVSSPLCFYGNNVYATRFDPQQLNAFESEMLALAAAMSPTGTWNSGTVTNLANAFANFTAHWSGGSGGSSITLSNASTYPANAGNDVTAATPAYVSSAVAAAITIAEVAAIAAAESGSATAASSAIATAVATAKAYTDASLAGLGDVPLAHAANYPADDASDAMSTTPAYVSAAVAAAVSIAEAAAEAVAATAATTAIATAKASAISTAETFTTAAIAALPAPTSLALGSNYPAASASNSLAATPAYVTAAVAAVGGGGPGLAVSSAYPADVASNILAATPAYVAAAVAAVSGGGPSLAVAADYPADVANDTLATTPAYVAAAVAAGGGGGGGGGAIVPPQYEQGPFAPPNPSWFTAINGSGVTTTMTTVPLKGTSLIAAGLNSGGQVGIMAKSVTSWGSTWAVTTRFVLSNSTHSYEGFGILLLDSTGQLITWQVTGDGNGGTRLGADRWNSISSYNGGIFNESCQFHPQWLRFRSDATNYYFGWSYDGIIWHEYTLAHTFLGTLASIGLGGSMWENGGTFTQSTEGMLITYYDDPSNPATPSAAVTTVTLASITANNPPTLASFTTVANGTGVTTAASYDAVKGLSVYRTDSLTSGDHAGFMGEAVPGAAPWTITAKANPYSLDTNYSRMGIAIYEASSGKMAILGVEHETGSPFVMILTMPNLDSYGGSLFFGNEPCVIEWWRISFDGTNYKFYVSLDDALSWYLIATSAATSIFTTAATHVGVGLEAYGNVNMMGILVKNWIVT